MIYPEPLRPGDLIAFPAPSCSAATEPYTKRFHSAMRKFQRLGYRCMPGPNAYKTDLAGYSADPVSQGTELTALFQDPSVKALFSIGGGELMCDALDHVDFEALRKAPPKWYMGYSDNTHMTFLMPTLLDKAAVYGPCAPEFGMRFWDPSLSDAFALVTGEKNTFTTYDKWEREGRRGTEHPLASFRKKKETVIYSENWDGKPFSGRFIGGCLDILQMYPGTKFDRVKEFAERYRKDGIIWFIESCDLNTLSMSRALWQMREAGWFRHVKAFLVGRPAWFEDESWGITHFEAVMREVRRIEKEEERETGVPRKIPVIMDLDIGHLKPMVPMLSGGFGTVSRALPPKGTVTAVETLDCGTKAEITRIQEEKIEFSFERK